MFLTDLKTFYECVYYYSETSELYFWRANQTTAHQVAQCAEITRGINRNDQVDVWQLAAAGGRYSGRRPRLERGGGRAARADYRGLASTD